MQKNWWNFRSATRNIVQSSVPKKFMLLHFWASYGQATLCDAWTFFAKNEQNFIMIIIPGAGFATTKHNVRKEKPDECYYNIITLVSNTESYEHKTE